MKCPKCGYVSFDHNQVCPKCHKDITGQRDRMNLPSYKPAPPSLLGALIGETVKPEPADSMQVVPDIESMSADAAQEALPDLETPEFTSDEIDDLKLDLEAAMNEDASDEILSDRDGLEFEDMVPALDEDLDDLAPREGMQEKAEKKEPLVVDDDFDLDLESLDLDLDLEELDDEST